MTYIKKHAGFYYLLSVTVLVLLFLQFSLTVPKLQQHADFDYTAFKLAAQKQYDTAAARFRKSAELQSVTTLKSMSYFYSALMHYNMKDYTGSLDGIVNSLQQNNINASAFTLLEWTLKDIPLQTAIHPYLNELQKIKGIDHSRLDLIMESYLERLLQQQNYSKFINLLDEPLHNSINQRYMNMMNSAVK